MKLFRLILWFGLATSGLTLVHAKPRHPFPKTPDEAGQNDRDLNDAINNRISKHGNTYCIDSPTFCVDAVNNRVMIGTTSATNPLDIYVGGVEAFSIDSTKSVTITGRNNSIISPQDGNTLLVVTNASVGANANAALFGSNGTSSSYLRHWGTNASGTLFGNNLAGSGLLENSVSGNGLFINTLSTNPVILGNNSFKTLQVVGQQVLVTTGTAAKPGLAIDGDSDSGFYSTTQNRINLSLGGTGTFTWASDTFFPISDGSADLGGNANRFRVGYFSGGTISAPGISIRDADTGIYSDNTKHFRIVVGSTLIFVGAQSGVEIWGTQTNDTADPGYTGEVISSVVSSPTNDGGTTVWTDLTSITLTPGHWMIGANMDFILNTGVALLQHNIGVSSTSGNSATGLVVGSSRLLTVPATANTDTSCTIVNLEAKLATTTTYYLKFMDLYTSGQPQARGRVTAIRL